jgi:uncharacterized protein (DUF305 family)
MNRIKWLAVILFGIVASLPGLSQSVGRDKSATVSPAWPGLMVSVKHMHAAMMSAGPSVNSDVDFVRLMLPHHQAALEMARVQLMYGKDPQMRRLAQEIITDQQSEVELMQLWLKRHVSSDGSMQPVPAK